MREKAPEFPVEATWLNTKEPLSLERLAGHVVLLDFWTYCCINCMHILPELKALERRFADDPFVVVGVHSAKFISEKDSHNVRRAIARYEIEHPVVVDSEHDIWKKFGVKAWPTICLLDSEGRIAWQAGGEPDIAQLELAIGQLLERGRRAGTLADEPLTFELEEGEADTPLRFPGKLCVAPAGGMAALTGKPPGYGPIADGFMVVSDSNHWECARPGTLLLCPALCSSPWPGHTRSGSTWSARTSFTSDGSSERSVTAGSARRC